MLEVCFISLLRKGGPFTWPITSTPYVLVLHHPVQRVICFLAEGPSPRSTTGMHPFILAIKGSVGIILQILFVYFTDFPATWEEKLSAAGDYLFPVAAGTQEYQDAVKEFKDTINAARYTIVEVSRVQNHMEYTKHIALKEALREKHHKRVTCRRLFHGSNRENLELIAAQGFNRNYAADVNGELLN